MLTLQKGDDSFPAIHTLLPSEPVSLPESWQAPEFLTYLLQICKSKSEEDQRFSGIESFLAAQGRKYEIDRFTNLWTAMNALYSNTALRCRQHIENACGLTEKLPDIAGTDSASMTLFMRLMKANPSASVLKTQQLNQKVFRELGDRLAEMDDEQIKALYTDSKNQALQGKPSKNTLAKKYPSLEDFIMDKNQAIKLELFFLLLFWFPYICRCSFLHGRKPTILTAFADEYELQYLHKVNIFLQCFLAENLPQELFSQYDTKLLIECYVSSISGREGERTKELLRDALEGMCTE